MIVNTAKDVKDVVVDNKNTDKDDKDITDDLMKEFENSKNEDKDNK